MAGLEAARLAVTFEAAVQHVLNEEGGLSEHPTDPGGRTRWGITQATLDAARDTYGAIGLPQRVDELTVPQAIEIYRAQYWHAVRGDDLPVGVSLVMLDIAVNHGPGFAARALQQALGVKVDGWIGVRTLAAARAADRVELIAELTARRTHHYMLQDSIDDHFGLGWARRCVRTFRAACREARPNEKGAAPVAAPSPH